MGSQNGAQTLAEVFRDLVMAERSGVLVLAKNGEQRHVFFDRGLIVLGAADSGEHELGSYLLASGVLSPGALAEARENVPADGDTRDLARALVLRELIARAPLRAAARALTDAIVREAFAWEGGSARFSEGRRDAGVLDSDVIATAGVLLSAIDAMTGFERLRDALLDLDNRLVLAPHSAIPLQRLALSPSHGFILSRIDGNTTLSDVVSILPPGEGESAIRFLFGLLLLGVLSYDPPTGDGMFKVSDIMRDHADRQALEKRQETTISQVYELIRTQNPHEMLGVDPSASAEEIKAAYEQMKWQFGRERLIPRVREQFRKELTLIESRLVEAYLTLTKVEQRTLTRAVEARRDRPAVSVDDLNVRVDMDKSKAKLKIEESNRAADAHYARAQRSMREGDFFNSIQYAKLAISYNPSDARYYFLLAECQARNPDGRWQRQAEDNFRKTTQLDPWNVHYWMTLGRFYKRRGMALRARKQFEEALKLNPKNNEIITELDAVR